jgi:hypothetical protein
MDDQELCILDDDPLPGPAAVLDACAGTDDADAAFALQDYMREAGVAVSGARFGLGDIRRLVRRIRDRSLVRDLGAYPTNVEWLGFHVPPGGSASLALSQETARAGSVKLKVMGLGFGSGRSIKLGSAQNFGVRDRCFTLGVKLQIRLRTYTEHSGREDLLQVDVEQVLGSFLATPAACTWCFKAPAPGAVPREREREWDLTDDPTGLTETVTYELGESADVEIGLNLPGAGLGSLTPSVAVNRSFTSSCVAMYTFPGKARFTSYRQIPRALDLPFWGRS